MINAEYGPLAVVEGGQTERVAQLATREIAVSLSALWITRPKVPVDAAPALRLPRPAWVGR